MATEARTLALLKDFWKSSEQEHNDCWERFKENYRFVVGGDQQWDAADITELNDAGKPHLTYNEILPKINVLIAEFLDNAMEPKVFARRGGIVTVANVLTALAKHAMDLCSGDYQEAVCFQNGIAGGLGWLHWKTDYEQDPFNGDAVVESKWPGDIRCDESAKEYDINKSGKFIFEEWWWDKDELVAAHPKFRTDILGAGLQTASGDAFYPRQAWYNQRVVADYGDPGDEDVYSQETGGSAKWRYRVRDCWWKSYEKMPFLWDRERSVELVRLKGKSRLAIARELQARAPQRFKIIDRLGPILHRTRQAGQLILEDIEDPMGPRITRFPFSRFAPYWFGGYWMGVVDNAKDPQRELNKRLSQCLHIINTAANNLWLNKKKGGADRGDLEDTGARTGGVVDYDETEPKQAKAPGVPQGHFTLAQANAEAIGRIMGVREPMEGGSIGKDQSGIAIQRMQLQGMKMARPMLANFSRTRRSVYEGLIELVRFGGVYSKDEIIEVVGKEDLLDPELMQAAASELGPEPMPPTEPNPDALAALERLDATRGSMGAVAVKVEFGRAVERYKLEKQLYDLKLTELARQKLFEQIQRIATGRYGVKISQSLLTPTLRLGYFQQMLDARREGLSIPDETIIEASEWPNKDKLIERMQQMATVG
jgi:hypothetical protein